MCINPQTITTPQGVKVVVSCQRCFECIRKRKLDWQIRIASEVYASDVSFFSLISYNDDFLPDPDLPDKGAIQRLVKSLRSRLERNFFAMKKDFNKPISLKYFIVSEYGEERNRLHYHAIFMINNVDYILCNRIFWKELLENTWGKGFCSAFDLQPCNIAYVTKYIQKEYNMLLSSRLGLANWLQGVRAEDFTEWLYVQPSFVFMGKPHIAPRSWRLKLLGKVNASLISNNIRCKNLHSNKPDKMSYTDKLLINEKFLSDNPRYIREEKQRFNNSDILPNGEF